MDLTHHFLLSMPTLANSWFDKSITYIFEHNESGAIGFVINRHTQLVAGDIYDQLSIDCHSETLRSAAVFQGGPVDGERGFILCDSNTVSDKSATIDDVSAATDEPVADRYSSNEKGVGVSSSLELLSRVGAGDGPDSHLLLLGYAGWAAGQLESEIASNSWLTCEASMDIIFNEDVEAKFTMAAESIGIDFSLMTGEAGHA